MIVICFGKETVSLLQEAGSDITNGIRLGVPIQLNIGSKEKSEITEGIG